MTKKVELIGKKVGKLVVLEFSHKTNKEYFKCLCECGNYCLQSRSELLSEIKVENSVRSCGCSRKEANANRILDISGQVFGRLKALTLDPNEQKWLCICDCGKEVFVRIAALRNGNTTSCGCKRAETCGSQLLERHELRRASLGISKEDFSENYTQRMEFLSLSKEILKRDEYTCAWCSQIGGDLNVHHLDFWSKAPDKRFDTLNLVTLCKSCHFKIHQGNFHGDPDPIMDILLRGFPQFSEAYCTREEVTPN